MAISRSLIPQQISKGGKKMPKVGKKHFKYTKEGREKAKKHAKKTGLEVTNRKYYASGGAVYGEARKRKPTGRLSDKDITNALRAAGAGSAGWLSPKGFEGLSPIRKPVPRKKKLYTTLQQQSKVQKRKKAKRRAAGTKHMGKPRSGVAGLLKYFRQPLKGK